MSITSVLVCSLLWLSLQLVVLSAAQNDDRWCPTSVTPLPTLLSNLSSYTLYGAADDECSDFFFSAILTSPASSSPSPLSSPSPSPSPSILLRASPSLNVTHINTSPIPATLLSSGLRYIGGMAYFALHLYAPLTSTPPPSLTPHHLHPRTSPPSPPQSALLVLSTSTLSVVFSYPLASPITLSWVVIDYGTSPAPTLYSSSTATSTVLAFAISDTGELIPLPSLTLPTTLPPVTGATLLNPGTLLLLSFLPFSSPSSSPSSPAPTYLTTLTSFDMATLTPTPMANLSTPHPPTSTADVWSTDLPGFGSIHFITRAALYNYDLC